MSRLVDYGEGKLGVPIPDHYDTDSRSHGYESRTQWFIDVAKVTVTDLISKAFRGLSREGSSMSSPLEDIQVRAAINEEEG